MRFAHAAVRDTVYGEVPARERGRRHARAARRLAAAHAAEETVAAHLLATGPGDDDPEWVLRGLRAAVARAAERGAPATAARLLRRALDEPLEAGTRRVARGRAGAGGGLAGSRPPWATCGRPTTTPASPKSASAWRSTSVVRCCWPTGPARRCGCCRTPWTRAATPWLPALAIRAQASS